MTGLNLGIEELMTKASLDDLYKILGQLQMNTKTFLYQSNPIVHYRNDEAVEFVEAEIKRRKTESEATK